MDTTPDIILRAIANRRAAGLSVEVIIDGLPHVRHCANVADRDAYIARATARGEKPRILEGAQ